MASTTFRSVFAQVFDAAVIGSGYAAYAAALRLAEGRGARVLLLSRRPDLLWETGRAFETRAGQPAAAGAEAEAAIQHWHQLLEALGRRHGASQGQIDGGIAEVHATGALLDAGVSVLYYATPVATELDDGALAAITVAGKDGLHRVRARKWLDVSDEALLARLLTDTPPRRPDALRLHAAYQHHAWPDALGDGQSLGKVPVEVLQGASGAAVTASVTVHRSPLWPAQRMVTADVPGEAAHPRHVLLAALERLHERLPEVMQEAVLSHCSIVAMPQFWACKSKEGAALAQAAAQAPANVRIACPGYRAEALRTPADRYVLGYVEAVALEAMPAHEPSPALADEPVCPPASIGRMEADICVAGGGTAGALAAVAAARGGATVLCLEPLDFPGGIGAGGGIHWYYFGVTGGLQQELDDRVHALSRLFGQKKQVHGFHPDARKFALQAMLDEAGVRFLPGATLFDVTCAEGHVSAASVAMAGGAWEVHASQWIDATGDGDLCARAGAPYRFGRQGDGLLHAYSQSSGRVIQEASDPVRMRVVNYDAGWVDPTSIEDLTRGRLTGIHQYLCDTYESDTRPTYIAPAIGLRQGRQIQTRQVITLADLIERRQFPDAIGYTGSHYDNHTVEYEFESDEGMFWVWACEQWRGTTACDMPYGMLLPQGLDNVWIACRAAGVSDDAHHSCRMQRDMQRIGEAAGWAAAIAHRTGVDAAAVDYRALRAQLEASGALRIGAEAPHAEYGPMAERDRWEPDQSDAAIQAAVDALSGDQPGRAMWQLYRTGESAAAVLESVAQGDHPAASFRAAAVGAMLGQPWAQARLLAAIHALEDGYADRPEKQQPSGNPNIVPRWWSAIALLRICGDESVLPAFEALFAAGQPAWPLHVRSAVACTIERLLQRGVALESGRVQALLETLVADPMPGSVVIPRRIASNDLPGRPGTPGGPTAEERKWQLHLVIARIRLQLDLPVQPQAEGYLADPRALVRRQFEKLLGIREPLAASPRA